MSCIEKQDSAKAPEVDRRVRGGTLCLTLAAGAMVLFAVERSHAQVTATIDRVTGAVSLRQVGGSSELKGYTLKSDSGLLSPENWNSLEDQSVAGWGEAHPRPNQLSELNLLESTILNDGESRNLGKAYSGGAIPPRGEDVTFEYWVADGSVLTGSVGYTGPANDLVLNVDPATGAATLQNLSALVGDFNVNSYNILSDSGSLLPVNFTGIGEDGWLNSNPKSTSLAELNLQGSKVFSEGTTVSLGNIFDPNGTQDLRLQFGNTLFELKEGTVEYGDGAPVGPTLLCDLNADGAVGFPDFLILSSNFGQAGGVADGDCAVPMDGQVGFPDFLQLSSEFGQSSAVAGASVPEPTTAILSFIGVLGMLTFRKRAIQSASVLVVCGLLASVSQQTWAEDFDSRFIRLDPAGRNNQIDTTVEARAILAAVPLDAEPGAAVGDYVIAEHLVGKLDIVDLAGGAGSFDIDNPYLNDVNDSTMIDFLQYVSGTLQIPEGEWAIGFGSDDGGFLNMPSISFVETFNENGPTAAGDGEIIFNAPRGHGWTGGNFVVPAGGVTTAFEALFYERGGGDSFEIAVVEGFAEATVDFPEIGFELEDGVYNGWVVTGAPFDPFLGNPGDFNLDGTVDIADWTILSSNFGTGTSITEGDINLDRQVDLLDASQFHAVFSAAAAAVPEPATMSLLLLAVGIMFGSNRHRRLR